MNFRTLILGAASIAVLLPCVSNASPENAALDACVRAFAESMATPGSSAPAIKLKYQSSQPGSAIAEYYSSRQYIFELQARDPKTGATVARATCTSDTRGAQLALTATPLDGHETKLASR